MLFGLANADPVAMNVRYAPQPIGDAPFAAKLGEKALIGIELKSNPAPTDIKWTKSTTDSQSSNETVTTDLENGDKYLIGDLVDLGNQRFRADMTVNAVTNEDLKASYHLILTNAVGSVSYEFKLTTRGKITPVISNSLFCLLKRFVLIGIGCVMICVAIGVVIYKKCTTDSNEASHLLN